MPPDLRPASMPQPSCSWVRATWASNSAAARAWPRSRSTSACWPCTRVCSRQAPCCCSSAARRADRRPARASRASSMRVMASRVSAILAQRRRSRGGQSGDSSARHSASAASAASVSPLSWHTTACMASATHRPRWPSSPATCCQACWRWADCASRVVPATCARLPQPSSLARASGAAGSACARVACQRCSAGSVRQVMWAPSTRVSMMSAATSASPRWLASSKARSRSS